MGKNKIVSVVTVVLAFILIVAMKPGDNPTVMFRIASITATIVFIGTIIYTKVLWRVPCFKALHKIVDIGGKWQGKLLYEDGSKKEVYTVIKQTLDDVKIIIKTDNFFTDSMTCSLSKEATGIKLFAVYKSKPNGKVDAKKRIEYGTFMINCDEDFLDGIFFNSVGIIGKIELYRK